eukprot:CAMPEP_0182482640 /NCGR_PEP_ID=MMETSP1319-20130603/39667_1 /TAXON_ID=172717 /ORGANISM="Bolidomonas pacifica, Strain RCC208" /LENGTH=453 /DNA_ID=CAMNT_0024684365 /DNA_START=87 /DNA_END=1444 /DNA_ORIENTATION=-
MSDDPPSVAPSSTGGSHRNRTLTASARARKLWAAGTSRARVVNAFRSQPIRSHSVPCCSCCICFRDPDDKDKGVPPVCLKHKMLCLFHPQHPLLAESTFAKMFSNIGYKYFDSKRRVFFAVAFVWTLTAFLIGSVGCLAVFNDEYLLRFTYWASGTTYKGLNPKKGVSYSAIYIGLSGYSFYNCTNTSKPEYIVKDGVQVGLKDSFDFLGDGTDFECFNEVYPWEYITEDEGSINQGWAGKCPVACAATVLTAISSVVTLVFAMIGALNRMNIHSDAPQQKMLGCITDTMGAVTLAMALLSFEKGCFDDMNRKNLKFEGPAGVMHEFPEVQWWRGGSYWIYWLFCFTGGCVRALVHWLTPCPGLGIGFFTWKIPTKDEMNRALTDLKTGAEGAVEKAKEVGWEARLKGREVKTKVKKSVKNRVVTPVKTFVRSISSADENDLGLQRPSGGSSG